jgi:hypothetical protein
MITSQRDIIVLRSLAFLALNPSILVSFTESCKTQEMMHKLSSGNPP